MRDGGALTSCRNVRIKGSFPVQYGGPLLLSGIMRQKALTLSDGGFIHLVMSIISAAFSHTSPQTLSPQKKNIYRKFLLTKFQRASSRR